MAYNSTSPGHGVGAGRLDAALGVCWSHPRALLLREFGDGAGELEEDLAGHGAGHDALPARHATLAPVAHHKPATRKREDGVK